MQTVTTIGLDVAKSVFQVHGELKRRYVLAFFQKSPSCMADGGARAVG